MFTPAESCLKGLSLDAGMRIGDEAAMGRILVRNEPGNSIIDEVAPIAVCFRITHLA